MYVLLVRVCYHLCSRQHRLRRSYCLVHPLSNKWMLEDDLCLLIHTWDCRKTQGTKLKSYCWCCKWDTSLDGKPLYCNCMQLRMYILYNNVYVSIYYCILWLYIYTYIYLCMVYVYMVFRDFLHLKLILLLQNLYIWHVVPRELHSTSQQTVLGAGCKSLYIYIY